MTSRRPKRPALTRPPFPAAGVPLLRTAPDPQVAEWLGISAYAVKAERKRRGIAPYPGGPKPVGGSRIACRTLKLTAAEAAAQDAAAGDRPWASWARDKLVAAATSTT